MRKFLTSALLLLLLLNSGSTLAKDSEYHFIVKHGDSLSRYFSKLGLSSRLLANLLSASPQNKQLNQLNIGESVVIRLRSNRRFKSLSYRSHKKGTLEALLIGTRFVSSSNKDEKIPSPLLVTKIVISSSFGYDAQKAGLGLSVINTVVKALSWHLNFDTDLRKGDRFFVCAGEGVEKGARVQIGDL
jgi:murein DD-endopeptidase